MTNWVALRSERTEMTRGKIWGSDKGVRGKFYESVETCLPSTQVKSDLRKGKTLSIMTKRKSSPLYLLFCFVVDGNDEIDHRSKQIETVMCLRCHETNTANRIIFTLKVWEWFVSLHTKCNLSTKVHENYLSSVKVVSVLKMKPFKSSTHTTYEERGGETNTILVILEYFRQKEKMKEPIKSPLRPSPSSPPDPDKKTMHGNLEVSPLPPRFSLLSLRDISVDGNSRFLKSFPSSSLKWLVVSISPVLLTLPTLVLETGPCPSRKPSRHRSLRKESSTFLLWSLSHRWTVVCIPFRSSKLGGREG